MQFYDPRYSYSGMWPVYPQRPSPRGFARMPATASISGDSPGELRLQAEQLKNLGNEYRKNKMYAKALDAYQQAIQTDSRYTDAYFNMGQLHALVGNMPKAIQALTQLLFITPNDHDARVVLGEYYEKAGNTQEAKKRYMEVLQAKPDFDPASRRLDYLLYLDQKRFYPETAQTLMDTQYREIIHKARSLLKQFYTLHHPNPIVLKLSQEIPIAFEDTQMLGETANIAEYDNRKGLIRVHPQMMFSTPNIVAAYLVHELVHAVDQNDSTSIIEEQDGYRALARFWSIYKGPETDPNLDRAVELYQRSPDALDQEVRRIYTIRDATIPERSAGHGLPATSAMAIASQEFESKLAVANLQRLKQALALKASQK